MKLAYHNKQRHKYHICNLTQEKYKCHLCEATVKTSKGLQSHLDRHQGTLSHKCPECHKTFGARSEVNRHLMGVHRRELGANEGTIDREDR